MRFQTIAASVAAMVIGTTANAAVLQFGFQFATNGTPNAARLAFTLDTDALVTGDDQTDGLSDFSSNFDVDIGVAYDFDDDGRIVVGGLANGVGSSTLGSNDFFVNILNFESARDIQTITSLVQTGQGFIDLDGTAIAGVIGAAPATVVPLPAGLPLLLAGLGGLALLRRRR